VNEALALELCDIRRRFGRVEALRGASLRLHRGEIHALLGENGAGKTTLMQVAYGLIRPDGGDVMIGGSRVVLRSPRDARRRGVGMVHQHSTSVPALTVAENVALAAGWRPEPGRISHRVAGLCNRLSLPLDPAAIAGRLSVALKQRLEIVKALAADARILLFDEPTAVLAPAESAELLALARRLADEGCAVLIITHKLAEAMAAADRITVLRHGSVTWTGARGAASADQLATAMLGRAEPVAERRARPIDPATARVLVRIQSLDVPRDGRHGTALRGANLVVHEGEIVGIAAVEGSGQRELLRAVAGVTHPLRGVLQVAEPVAFIPEDRTTEGLIPPLSLTENVVLGLGGAAPWARGLTVRWAAARARTAALIERFDIRADGPDTAAETLSGGNQQKLVVARALELAPRVIVAENPTRGLDVRAANAVHARLRDAARGGAAVLLHSSDLDEVLERSDRIVVAHAGLLRAPAPGADRDAIGRMLVGAE
jgi:simple sugar transport system ATP-binding protein